MVIIKDSKGRGFEVAIADPDPIPEIRHFVGREEIMRRCRAAWGIDPKSDQFPTDLHRLHFRLEGPPGVGKNEIAYHLARELATGHDIPFYMIQGHEEMTPEDLAILLVPDPTASTASHMPLTLRASPLASAIYEGGIFFFDEINRVPERALSPLAAVLDSRQYIYSAITGIHIKPKDEAARRRFRFCCALNPEISTSVSGVLPEYIDQRTLPVIHVPYPSRDEMIEMIRKNVGLDQGSKLIKEFEQWYERREERNISMRQALSLMMLAVNHGGDLEQGLEGMPEN